MRGPLDTDTVKHGGLGDASRMCCIIWHWNPAVCGEQDGFIEDSLKRKHHAVCKEAEALMSLDLTASKSY